jgi:exopolysaccharide biosynthesis protein
MALRQFALLALAVAVAACSGARVARAPRITPASFPFPVDTNRTATVAKDVKQHFIYSPTGPWAISVLEVRTSSCLKAVAAKGTTSAVGRVKTSDILRALDRQREVVGGVNADFFSLQNGVPTNLLVMDGRMMTPPSGKPVFAVDSTGAPHIIAFESMGDGFAVDDPMLKTVALAPFHPREAVGGRPRLLSDSSIVPDVDTEGAPGFATGRHPRTAVGFSSNGTRLLLVVVDGRRPGYSDGMTLRELANLMRALGAREALNLDGGGSTTMVISNPRTNVLEIVNRPSDAAGERTVGNALAIVNSCARK